MTPIGLLGGMSWELTVPYYQTINGRVAKKLGGLHSAKIVLYSRGRLESTFGLTVHIPGPGSREPVHEVIYADLCRGIVSDSSREKFQQVAAELVAVGAEAAGLFALDIVRTVDP